MKKTIYSGFAALATFFMVSCNQGANTDSVEQAQETTEQQLETQGTDRRGGMEMDDAEQMINLASSDMFEIEAGRLAAERGTNPEVKSFGQMMVEDHTKASQQMKTLAQNKNITLPTTMGNDHQEELSDLRNQQGADFDREYMDAMVSSHEDAISRLEDLQDSDDAQIKSFAQTMLPTIRQHHERAQTIEDQVNTTGTRADRDTRRRGERDQRGGYRYRVQDGAADAGPGNTGAGGTGTTRQ
jgi:putative membrane protein